MFNENPDPKHLSTGRSLPVPPGPKPTNVLNDDNPVDQDYTSSSPLSEVSNTSDHSEYLLPHKKPASPAPRSPPAQPVLIEISDDEDAVNPPKASMQAKTETRGAKARPDYLTAKWGPLDEPKRHQEPMQHEGSASTSQLHIMLQPIEPPALFHTKSSTLTKRASYHELPKFRRRLPPPGANPTGGANTRHDLNLPGPKTAGGPRLPGPNRTGGVIELNPRGPNAPGPNSSRGLIPRHPRAPNSAVSNRARPTYLPTPRHAQVPRTSISTTTTNAPGRARASPELPRLLSSPQFRAQPTTPACYASPAVFHGSTPKAPSVSPLTTPAKPRRYTQMALSNPADAAAKPATPQPTTQIVHSSLPSSPELPLYARLDKTGTSITRLHRAIRGVLAQGDEDAIRTLATELRHDWEVDGMALYVEGFLRGALFEVA